VLVNQRIYYRKTGTLSNNTIRLQVFTETIAKTEDGSGSCMLDDGVISQSTPSQTWIEIEGVFLLDDQYKFDCQCVCTNIYSIIDYQA